MIKSFLSFCFLFVTLHLTAQPPTITQIEIIDDVNVEITVETNGWVNILGHNGQAFGVTNPYTYTSTITNTFGNTIIFIGTDNDGNSEVSMTPIDEAFAYLPNDIVISDETGCGNCDGSVCHSINGNPVSYSIDLTNSVNGCVSNLCSGTYTMEFDNVVSGGITFINPDYTFELEEFQVSIALSPDGTEVESTITGGSGNYLITFSSPGGLTSNVGFIAYDFDGCYSITVTDLTTSCTTSTSEYIYTENIGLGLDAIGDLNNDGLINATDLLEFLGAFGTSNSDPNWTSLSDFNCDGLVNAFDLLFFLSVFPG